MPEPRIRRVLMTTDTVGGVWNFSLELARALGAHRVEVVLAALGGNASIEQQAEAASIPNLLLLSSDFRLEWMNDPWRDVSESRGWLIRLERECGPDVLHLNTFGLGAQRFRAPVVLTAHSCVLSWWKAVEKEPAPPEWNRYRGTVAQALSSAARVSAPSQAMASTLEANYGFALPSCTVIPNGRDSSDFRPGPKESFILTAGRLWDDAKNTAAVARAARRLSWPVFAAGSTSHPDGRTPVFAGCRLLGRLPTTSLAEWYAHAAIFALPARYEPFGLSALEAALSGCALVLGDIGSLREIWRDAAMFVDPDDERSLIEAIESLIGNADLRARMSQLSYNRALTFDAQRMASAYLNLYRTAIGPRQEQCVS